jgi:putative DNA primase/helicase
MHFNKKADVTNAMLRIADGLAYVAAARHVYVVVDDSDNDKMRLFVKAKNNLAPDKSALRFGVGTRHIGNDPDTDVEIWAPHVEWDNETVEVTATEAMEAAEAGKGPARERRGEAEEFLKSKLVDGPVPTKDIEEEARAQGISVGGALKRARKELGVVVFKQPGQLDAGWFMKLPEVRRYDRD